MTTDGAPQPGLTGVLLAAGRGRRMGTTKQLLPWPPNAPVGTAVGTVIESAFDAIAPHCERMIVVLGHETDAIEHALGGLEFVAVESDSDAEMFDSIKAGLRRALEDDALQAVLLHPADHPEIAATVIAGLLERHGRDPTRATMPEHQGRGGHPVLVPRAQLPGILEYEGVGGLRAYWSATPESCRRLPMEDASCVRDLDTPEDYARES